MAKKEWQLGGGLAERIRKELDLCARQVNSITLFFLIHQTSEFPSLGPQATYCFIYIRVTFSPSFGVRLDNAGSALPDDYYVTKLFLFYLFLTL